MIYKVLKINDFYILDFENLKVGMLCFSTQLKICIIIQNKPW